MAYYALFELGIMPWDLAEFDIRKKAAILGMVKVRAKKEKQLPKK